ncbi:MAG: hypothetical protein OXH69_09430 [Acidobacteria bacterium]|nr:hypothetical protein [Acidobacteriota bacterium]
MRSQRRRRSRARTAFASAGHVTGASVVCGEPEPELTSLRAAATSAPAKGEVWQGSDGALDQ